MRCLCSRSRVAMKNSWASCGVKNKFTKVYYANVQRMHLYVVINKTEMPSKEKLVFEAKCKSSGDLLLIAGKMMRMGPDHIKQLRISIHWRESYISVKRLTHCLVYTLYLVRGERRLLARVELLKQFCNFAHNALVFLKNCLGAMFK